MKRVCTVDGCGKAHIARGFCKSHWHRWNRYGDPLEARGPFWKNGTRLAATRHEDDPRSFLEEVVLRYEGDECLFWPFSKNKGYARLARVAIHQLACEAQNGPRPTPKHEASHSCGQGRAGCVAKRHLVWKTHADNLADRKAHGTLPRGERNGQSKLTESDVRAVRNLRGIATRREIAAQFKISKRYVGDIQVGKRWGWLP